MAFVGKRLKALSASFDKNKLHALDEAVDLVKKNATSKFAETVELVMNLNVDPRKADQQVRGVVLLPHGTGKAVKVAVFAKDAKAEEARKAGAEHVGAEDLMEKIQKGSIAFDRCIATPDMMAVVGRLGKILGPRGLMPNPKLGTVTMDVAAAIEAAKGGQIEYRTEKNGIVHAGVGKATFSAPQLKENILAVVKTIVTARPAGVKGTFVLRVSLSSTMGPGVKVDVAEFKN